MKTFHEEIRDFFNSSFLTSLFMDVVRCVFFSIISLMVIFTVSLFAFKYGKWLYAFLGL